MNRKVLKTAFISVLVFLALLPSCHREGDGGKGKISIVTTIYPIYDWVMEIVGDGDENVEVSLLLDGSIDMHSYQMKTEDLVRISSCDLFLYVGGESEGWTEAALRGGNEGRREVSLFSILEDRLLAEEGEDEMDEHVWLSLSNASLCVERIASIISSIDSENSGIYMANAAAYMEKLRDLDGRYRTAIESADKKCAVFGDRFPFRYLFSDYGLSYYAAFSGCSAESEASFETIVRLSEMVRQLGLDAVMKCETSDGKIARTVAESSGGERSVITLDSLQSSGAASRAAGRTYLAVMEDNLFALSAALASGGV